MKEAQHTPGPWRLDDARPLHDLSIWAKDGTLVAHIAAGSHENVDGTDTAMSNEEYAANASLLAAATELLDAARWAAEMAEYSAVNDPNPTIRKRYREIATLARGAVDKAEGR